MELVKLQGTKTQIEKADIRRGAFLSRWQERLSIINESKNATDKHTNTINEAVKYLSQIESAEYWLIIPTGNIDYPRCEVAEIDTRLYDFMIQTKMDWLEINGIKPHFLAPQI